MVKVAHLICTLGNFPNKTISSFRSVKATDFKNVIQNKMHWAAVEFAEV